MKELLSTNDVVLLSFIQDLLGQEGIGCVVLDQNMSLIEGSLGILPRRLMVVGEDYEVAKTLVEEQLNKEKNASDTELGADKFMEHLGVVEGEVEGTGLSESSEDWLSTHDVSDDQFLGGALKVYQSRSGFRSGIDAVLLGASVPAIQKNEGGMRVLEAGCGAGVVSLSIGARCGLARIDAIEIEPVNAELAKRNAARNGMGDRLKIIVGDLSEPVTKLEMFGLKRNSYDVVVANPPFYNEAETRVSSHPLRRRAKRAEATTLETWVRFMTAMAAPKGMISMIHKADKLEDILKVLAGRFGGVSVYPVFPKAGEPANRVIIQGIKGSRAPLRLLEGLVLHDDQGQYLAPVRKVCEGPHLLAGF